MASVQPLDDEQLQKIYTWIDQIPLSRPKRNITRDFSDSGALRKSFTCAIASAKTLPLCSAICGSHSPLFPENG